jgi:hypothetical protein
VGDAHKQGQYAALIKSLQEEQSLLREMEDALAALSAAGPGGGGSGLPSRNGSASASASVVRCPFSFCLSRLFGQMLMLQI